MGNPLGHLIIHYNDNCSHWDSHLHHCHYNNTQSMSALWSINKLGLWLMNTSNNSSTGNRDGIPSKDFPLASEPTLTPSASTRTLPRPSSIWCWQLYNSFSPSEFYRAPLPAFPSALRPCYWVVFFQTKKRTQLKFCFEIFSKWSDCFNFQIHYFTVLFPDETSHTSEWQRMFTMKWAEYIYLHPWLDCSK